jgi:hypothetical protein
VIIEGTSLSVVTVHDEGGTYRLDERPRARFALADEGAGAEQDAA